MFTNTSFENHEKILFKVDRVSQQDAVPYEDFSYAGATESEADGDDFMLDYTSGQVGVNLSFHSPINHK